MHPTRNSAALKLNLSGGRVMPGVRLLLCYGISHCDDVTAAGGGSREKKSEPAAVLDMASGEAGGGRHSAD
jgi:hypothetical protein